MPSACDPQGAPCVPDATSVAINGWDPSCDPAWCTMTIAPPIGANNQTPSGGGGGIAGCDNTCEGLTLWKYAQCFPCCLTGGQNCVQGSESLGQAAAGAAGTTPAVLVLIILAAVAVFAFAQGAGGKLA